MDSSVVASLVAGSGALIVAILSLIVNASLERGRIKRQSADSTAQREALAIARHEDYEHQRTERSYADRRDALLAFLVEADRLELRAAESDFYQASGIDQSEPDAIDIAYLTSDLARRHALVDLVAGKECRVAAQALSERIRVVLDKNAWAGLPDARDAFVAAARGDLALPADAPQVET